MNTFSPGRPQNSLLDKPVSSLPPGSKIVVIGAGVFGGWSALYLQRKGYKVTLIDQWGPGNSRASSGGDTRLMRCIYGDNPFYTSMANRAYTLWLENEKLMDQQYLFPTGCLWLVDNNADDIIEKALPIIEKEGLEYEKLTPEEVGEKYPQINSKDLKYVVHEKKTGYLMAREACEGVKDLFIKEGGDYILDVVAPGNIKNNQVENLVLGDGSTLSADLYLFACGPWLKTLFPDVLSDILTVTRQEIYYFGLPSNKAASIEQLPTWIDHSPPDFYYGVPGGIRRGFKIAFDKRGLEVDPTTQDRNPTSEMIQRARQYISKRFNGMGDLPLIESRVCQYSDTIEGNFIFDKHPEAENIWLLGGGSGHGYKHGPALGELVSQTICGEAPLLANLRLS